MYRKSLYSKFSNRLSSRFLRIFDTVSRPNVLFNGNIRFVSSFIRSAADLPPLIADENIQFQESYKSVVKVYSEYKDPYWALPWQMLPQRNSSGSGFAIEGRLLMTNAHCIANHTRVLVRKPGDPRKFKARVVAEGHECDLALLTVDDPDFWDDVKALPLGELPHLQEQVVVLGYPTGGDNLCVTSGVVSRVDVAAYAHSDARLLCTQIDAAVNPGNSGGPALNGNKVVGVAFQGYEEAQNIGYIIPIPVVRRFLADVLAHGTFTGFSLLGVTYQTLENSALRRLVGIDDSNLKNQLPAGVSASGVRVLMTDPFRREKAVLAIERRQDLRKRHSESLLLLEETLKERKAILQQMQDKLHISPQSIDFDSSTSTEESGILASLPRVDHLSTLKPFIEETIRRESNWTPESVVNLDDLQRDDVILSINGFDVADDATIRLRGGKQLTSSPSPTSDTSPGGIVQERVHMSHSLLTHFEGSPAKVIVLRQGKVEHLTVPVVGEYGLLGGLSWGKLPRFSIWGGLVFAPLTMGYLRSEFGRRLEGMPMALQQYFIRPFKEYADEEIVILSHILASDLTIGYDWRNLRLWKINGTTVRNLKHAMELLEQIEKEVQVRQSKRMVDGTRPRTIEEKAEDLVSFELDFSLELVLDGAEVMNSQDLVLKRHGIPLKRRI